MAIPDSAAGTTTGPGISDPLQVASNKIPTILTTLSTTALSEIHHVHLTSNPGDDLAEEDFLDRVRSLINPMTSLASLTICIPSMARLHPSNSLPKVLDVLHDVRSLHPKCSLSLAVHEAEQTWGALPTLQRIVKLELQLRRIEFTRAFFPVEALIDAARSCGLESLSLNASQIFVSDTQSDAAAPLIDRSGIQGPTPIPLLTSLAVHAHSDASPGLDLLLHTASSTLTHLDLSSNSSDSGITLRSSAFPRLETIVLREDFLSLTKATAMPALHTLTIPSLTQAAHCATIQEMLHSTCPRLQTLRISRIEAGEACEALVRLAETHASSISTTINNLAIRDPALLSPAALSLAENLVNAGPPIAGPWPPGFGGRMFPRLKTIALKVHEGGNVDEFLEALDAPNLVGVPSVSLIRRRKGKGGK